MRIQSFTAAYTCTAENESQDGELYGGVQSVRNGYFQIGCTGGGTVVRLVKPVDGGNEVTAREIAEYLSGHGIVYDAGLLT